MGYSKKFKSTLQYNKTSNINSTTWNALKSPNYYLQKALLHILVKSKTFNLKKFTSIYKHPVLIISSRHCICIKKYILQGKLLIKHIGTCGQKVENNMNISQWKHSRICWNGNFESAHGHKLPTVTGVVAIYNHKMDKSDSNLHIESWIIREGAFMKVSNINFFKHIQIDLESSFSLRSTKKTFLCTESK